MDPNILITGSNGLLGTELKKYLQATFIGREEMDITVKDSIKTAFKKYAPDVVVHLAAYTDVGQAYTQKKLCYRTNVWATGELAARSPMFIYMSTEYVFDGEKGNYHEESIPNPVNFYALTKLLGEFEAKRARKYAILRAVFKPRPYKHTHCPTDMWTSGDYVDVIAPMIAKAIVNYKTLPKTLHIGGKRKNLYQLASKTRKVIPIKRGCCPVRLPRDTSLDTTLWGMLKYDTSIKTNN